jgi:hypothetical protein
MTTEAPQDQTRQDDRQDDRQPVRVAASLKPTTIEQLRADSLHIDALVQRELVTTRVKRMAANLNLEGIGVLTVSRRPGGGDYIIDGQHRQQALLTADFGDYLVTCQIYHGLTRAQEAELFRLLNRTVRANAFDDFTKGVVAGDPECVAINAIVESCGLKIGAEKIRGNISAVTKLRNVYAVGGDKALRATLATIVNTWGLTHGAFNGQIIEGIGQFYAQYGEAIQVSDNTSFIRRLAKYEGGPDALLGRARHEQRTYRKPVNVAVMNILIGIYNTGRRTRRLSSSD